MKSNSHIKKGKYISIFNLKNKKNSLKYNYHTSQEKKIEIKSNHINFESEEKILEKIKKDNNQNYSKIKPYNINNKILNYFSQGNASSFEFMKNKNKNKSHNINDYEYKEVLLMNKYSPGYIYYKAYQNIIEKLNKKKIQSGKILFRKNADNKISNNKKRYKSGNIKKIYNINANNRYYLKNNDIKPLKKSNGFNSNNIFSKTYKSSFNHNKNNFKNIFSNLNNKNNPYSIHWANKILNINDVYLGVNYNTSVPLLKSLNIKRNPNQISIEIKKIQKNKNNTKNKIIIKDKREDQKNSSNNEQHKNEINYDVNELKEKSININNTNNNRDN